MRFSLFSLARLGAGVVLVSTALAIGLARLAPAPSGWRLRSPAPVTSVNSFLLDPCTRGSVWVDREGRRKDIAPPREGEVAEYLACSPWSDDRGRHQVVGRWSGGFEDGVASSSFGLFRMSFPDGEVLDHFEMDVVPVGPPCWFSGTQARVLFAAGDGRLYRYDFEPGEAGAEDPADRLRRITWECEVPGKGDVFVSDPSWPTDPRLRDVIVVGLRQIAGGPRGAHSSGPTQIWWLRLSRDGDSIVEAGPLVADSGDEPRVTERCPTLGRSADGRLRLAYYRSEPHGSMALELAEVEVEPGQGTPRVVVGSTVKLADDCLASPPIFSSDGRWLGVVRADGEGRDLRRVQIGDPSPGRTFASAEGPPRAKDAESSRLVARRIGAAY